MVIRLNLSGLVRYVSATERQRRRRALELRDQSLSEYSVATDFWRSMRVGIYNDRRTVRDGSVIQDIADQARGLRRPSYAVIAAQWPGIAERWKGAHFHRLSAADLIVGGVDVAVRPLFSEEWPDGTVEDVAVWMNLEAPTEAAVRAALRLMTRANPAPNSVATFVDVRRGKVWSSTDLEIESVDNWLEEIGERFLSDVGP